MSVTVSGDTITVTVSGPLPLAADIQAALNAANAPSAANAFATLADVAERLPLAVPVTRDWASADNCLLDVQDALGWSFQPGGGTQYALISLTRLTTGQSSSAALLVSMAGVIVVASYKVAWQAGVPEITLPAEEVLLTAITNFDPASQSEMTAHKSDAAAHAAINSRFDAAGTAATAVANHAAAVDPHGDRAFASAAVGEHESLTFDPHGDRAYTTSSIATHASAPDQHGDRAYASSILNAHNASVEAHSVIKSGIIQPFDGSHFASLGWNNQGTSMAAVYDDHVVIQPQITGGTTTYGMRCLEKTVPDGDADFDVIGAVMSIASTVGTHWTGIYVRYATMVYTVSLAGYTVVRADTRTTVSQTTAPSNIAQYATVAPAQPTWFKITRVGGTMTFHVSMDGQTWIQFASVLIGTVTFTHFGFFSEQRVASGWSAGQLNSLSVV